MSPATTATASATTLALLGRRLAPAAVLAAAWGLFVAYAWPGFMTWDSVNQLQQARSGHYGDWHPPIMARLWALLDAIVPGPGLMLILQTSLFIVGLYAIFRRYVGALPAAVIAACVFLFPPVSGPMSAIWKDSLMAAALMIAVAGASSPRRWAQVAGWIGLAAVAALRHNAPVLIVPAMAMLAPLPARWPAWRRQAIGAALGVAISLAGMAANRALTRFDEHPFANMLAMPDLAAVIAGGPAMSDDEVRALVDGVPLAGAGAYQARLRALDAGNADYLSLAQGDARVFDLVTTDAASSEMARAWRRAIAAHPGSYFAHRGRRLLAVLGLGPIRALPYVTPRGESAQLLSYVGETRTYSPFKREVGRLLGKISRSIIFWPMLYFAIAVGLLVVLWRDPLQRGLLLGAIGYELALMFVTPGLEYRYSHWMITCAVIATVVRFVELRRARRARVLG